MKLLTEKSSLKCQHMGVVRNQATQHWVTIANQAVLVENDPEGRDIDHCPYRDPAGQKPCLHTLKVHLGYSTFITIGKHAVCLDDLWGLTDGTPPGFVKYIVVDPEQTFVDGAA
jgi:hypothetical protein